jgi:uncharacterized protein YndB with AHSA1/START domain
MYTYSIPGIIDEIIHTEHIRAPVGEVFRAMTVARIIDEWGGGPARIQAKVGGKISLWDGEMSGIIRECNYPVKLVYTLREASWEESMLDSIVTWELKETVRGTQISLRHTGLPTRKIRETHNEGWGDYFLGPLKAYLERK